MGKLKVESFIIDGDGEAESQKRKFLQFSSSALDVNK